MQKTNKYSVARFGIRFFMLVVLAMPLLGRINGTEETSQEIDSNTAYTHMADQPFKLELEKASQYYTGTKNIKKDRFKARQLFETLANQGSPSAQKRLSNMYLWGQGGKEDIYQAVYWLRKAADQNDLDAMTRLGSFYALGQGVPKDLMESRKWHEKAALQGDVRAQYILGSSYLAEKDEEQGLFWLQKAAKQGDLLALKLLVSYKYPNDHIHLTDSKIPLPCSEGKDWGQKMNEYYKLLKREHGSNPKIKEVEKANEILESVAIEGCVDAQRILANHYIMNFINFNDQKRTKNDKKKALFWYQRAADQGDKTAKRIVEALED